MIHIILMNIKNLIYTSYIIYYYNIYNHYTHNSSRMEPIQQPTKVIVVIGAPGSGKGTQCKLISKQTGMIHISTGDLCREAILKGTELGRTVNTYISNGSLVPDEVMINVIEERLREQDAIKYGVLLDGYPRTIRQAKALVSKQNINIDRVILIQSTDNVCIERILSRRIDMVTGESYSLKFPECACNDQDVQKRLIRRDNDGDESMIQIRLKYYYMNLGQILAFFRGKIFAVNGSQGVKDVNLVMMKSLFDPIIPFIQYPEQHQTKSKTKTIIIQKQAKDQDQQCIICMSEPSNFLIVPCGHQCGCEGCLSQLYGQRNGKCPICRGQISGIVQVFKSGIDDNGDNEENNEEDTNNITNQENNDNRIAEQFEQLAPNEQEWAVSDMFVNQNMNNVPFNQNTQLSVSIAPCDNLQNISNSAVDVAVTIHVPDVDISKRVPVDICCVIDISGSMNVNTKYQDPEDETKTITDNLTNLDLVKHAVKTIISILTPQDRLSIVAFNSTSHIIFELNEMTDQAKRAAIIALEKLEADGQTNIWEGLSSGLETLRKVSHIVRKKNIFVLTDGQPTTSPPKGEHDALKQYIENHPDLKCQIHTFGFGYDLKSEILLNLAICGNGSFSFIPDAKILGTCLVNATANACSNFTQQCKVHLIPKNGSSFTDRNPIGGNLPFERTSWGLVVNLGPLQYGQTRDLIVNMHMPNSNHKSNHKKIKSDPTEQLQEEYLEVTVEFDNSVNSITSHGTIRQPTIDSIAAYTRNHSVSDVYDVISMCASGQGVNGVRIMKTVVGQITNIVGANQDTRITGLLNDVGGRMSKAISTVERFTRWGQHYLRAINRAHQLQLCTNFMDQGLQVYGGTLFNTLKDQGGAIFMTLELKRVPVQINPYQSSFQSLPSSQSSYQPSQSSYQSSNNSNNSNNSTYYAGSGGGCFDESCYVFVNDQKTKISQVKKGDQVTIIDEATGQKGTAIVLHKIRINRRNNRGLIKFVNSGLHVTDRHPVKINGEWKYPIDLVNNKDIIECDGTGNGVYNFILDKKQVGLLVNDIPCVTFGHYIDDVWHDFYGSDKVIKVVELLGHEKNNEDCITVENAYFRSLA